MGAVAGAPSIINWEGLRERHPRALVEYVQEIIYLGESGVLSIRETADHGHSTLEEAELLLNVLVEAGALRKSERRICPTCGMWLDQAALDNLQCSRGHSLEHTVPVVESVFILDGKRTRDTRWVIVLHGMNTRGAWQEEFAWLLARQYGYSVPVFIYKYGHILISPFVPRWQKRYVTKTIGILRARIAEMASEGITSPPDVIGHSFGTWLVAQSLVMDPSIVVGRLVLTGCIIRPDFDWSGIFQRRQVEFVLCHCAGRDCWPRLAAYTIPNAGPSGVYGFADYPGVVHALDAEFAHSDYFKQGTLRRVMKKPWGEFLTAKDPTQLPWRQNSNWSSPWKPPRIRWFTYLIKYVVLGVLIILLTALVVALGLGLRELIPHLNPFG